MTNLSKFSRIITQCFLTLAILLIGVAAIAQPAVRVSPPDIAALNFGGNRLTIYYSRPYSKDPRSGETRVIWGGLVPYNEVWRTGANEATLLVTQKDIVIGEATVPAGVYTLFTLPKDDGSMHLIINKQVGQWGSQYDESQDLVRIPMVAKDLEENVDQFTMQVARTETEGVAVIKLMWEKKEFSVEYKVAE